MSVRLRQSTLQGTGEEHRSDRHVVRAVESVDGEKAVVGDDGRVASEDSVLSRKGRDLRPKKLGVIQIFVDLVVAGA